MEFFDILLGNFIFHTYLEYNFINFQSKFKVLLPINLTNKDGIYK